jgi:hypothetical protein
MILLSFLDKLPIGQVGNTGTHLESPEVEYTWYIYTRHIHGVFPRQTYTRDIRSYSWDVPI